MYSIYEMTRAMKANIGRCHLHISFSKQGVRKAFVVPSPDFKWKETNFFIMSVEIKTLLHSLLAESVIGQASFLSKMLDWISGSKLNSLLLYFPLLTNFKTLNMLNENKPKDEKHTNNINDLFKCVDDNQSRREQTPDIVLSIQNEGYEETKYIRQSSTYVSNHNEHILNNDVSTYSPSCFSKEMPNEQNETTEKKNEETRLIKKHRKQPLQKRNLGAGEKHINELR